MSVCMDINVTTVVICLLVHLQWVEFEYHGYTSKLKVTEGKCSLFD